MVDALQTNGWKTPLHDHWLLDRLREFQQHPVPRSQCSLLESQDTYITLSGNKRTEEEHREDTLDEALPPGVFFASRKPPKSESHSDLGSVQQSSGSGNLSSQSSFEYPNNVWIAKDPGYTYMAVADSGVSMDYSPMSRADDIGKVVNYANDYKNEIPPHRRPFLVRQCPVHDDGWEDTNLNWRAGEQHMDIHRRLMMASHQLLGKYSQQTQREWHFGYSVKDMILPFEEISTVIHSKY